MIFDFRPIPPLLPFVLMLAGCSMLRVPGWLEDQSDSAVNGVSPGAGSSGIQQPVNAEMLLDQQRQNDAEWGIVGKKIPATTEIPEELERILVKRGIEEMYLQRYDLAGVTASAAPVLGKLCPDTIELYKRLGQLPKPVLPTEEQQQRIKVCGARKEYRDQVAARAYGPPEGFGQKTRRRRK